MKQDLDGCTVYQAKDLTDEAKRAVKGLGRYQGWDLRIRANGRITLIAWYTVKLPSLHANCDWTSTRFTSIAI